MSRPIEPVRRNALVDALRGACFVFMTVDHFPASPVSRFSNAYFGPFGFFTAALGFVFLSGLVAGWVYGGRLVRDGVLPMARSAVRRAGVLYLAQLTLCVLIAVATAVHLRGVANWDAYVFVRSPLKGLLYSGSLLYEPRYLGLLPMYCMFLLVTPLLVWQLAKGRAARVLALSVAVWLASGVFVRLPENPSGVDFGGFNPFSYQLLFVVGLAFGTGALQINALVAGRRTVLTGIASVIVAAFLVVRQLYPTSGELGSVVLRLHAELSVIELGPLRLVDFAAFAFLLYVVVQAVPPTHLRGHAARWLALIGRNSLPVFVWSIAITYLATALLPAGLDRPESVVALTLVVASLSIPALVRSRIRDQRLPTVRAGAEPAGTLVASPQRRL